MPVDRASYRPWEGTVRPSRRVTLAIAGTMIRRSMKQRLVRYLVRIVVLGVCLVSGFWFYLASSGVSAELRQFMQLPDLNPLAAVNRLVLQWTGGFALLMAAIVGTPLIAEDHKARALPLYFSRPITHLDYVLGKFLTVFWFLALLLLVPPVFMYVVELGFSAEAGLAVKRLPVLGKSLVPGLVGCGIYASLALGVSSLTEKTNQAALLYFGLVMIAFVMSQMLSFSLFGNDAWQAVSPGNCIQRIGAELLPLPAKARVGNPHVLDMPLTAAWTGAGVWTAAGLGVLVVRIRRVEVVS